MGGVLEGVNQRTQLVGSNRLELLMFRLGGRQRFGINVFKVQEVIHCPRLTQVPHASRTVCGIAHLRGKTVTVIDLAMAVGRPPLSRRDDCYIIITEYNRSVQGFLVSGVEQIVNMNWESILPPPRGAGQSNYMTAVTRVDEELVEIIDVERVLADVVGSASYDGPAVHAAGERLKEAARSPRVLVADDSSVARNQIRRTLEQMGLEALVAKDGREALQMLNELVADGTPIEARLALVISDIEMPEMDGYTLTTRIRGDARFKDVPVVLHTSLSGVFNTALVEKVGADRFVAKFEPEELANTIAGLLDREALAG